MRTNKSLDLTNDQKEKCTDCTNKRRKVRSRVLVRVCSILWDVQVGCVEKVRISSCEDAKVRESCSIFVSVVETEVIEKKKEEDDNTDTNNNTDEECRSSTEDMTSWAYTQELHRYGRSTGRKVLQEVA